VTKQIPKRQVKSQVETVNFRLLFQSHKIKVKNLQSQLASCFESYIEFLRCLVFLNLFFTLLFELNQLSAGHGFY
jgi:hypothetical protein